MHYINKIDKLLKERKINFKDMAEAIGMTRQGLKSSMNQDNLKVSTLLLIANFFKVPICYFFDEKESEYEKPDVDRVMKVLTEIIKERL